MPVIRHPAIRELTKEEMDYAASEAWRLFRGQIDDTKWSDLPYVVHKNWLRAAEFLAHYSGTVARRAAAVALNDALGSPVVEPVAKDLEGLIAEAGNLRTSLTASRNNVKALEERWRKACEADAAAASEVGVLRAHIARENTRSCEIERSLVSANAEIVRLNGCLNDALRDVAEVQKSNDRLRRIINGHEIGEASLSKQLDDTRRSLGEVHARYRQELERADTTILALREDLAAANKRSPPRWPGVRASILRRIGL